MSDPSYPAYPVLTFLGLCLVLIPLPWHLHAWNAGTCLYMMWTAVACLNSFVNSVLWHGNAINKAPVWCDISVHLIPAIAVAIPAASLCINRRLYKIATGSMVSVGRAEKRRAVLCDLCIGLGIPLVEVPLQYIVQGHRFDILEDIGCQPSQVNTAPAYPLVIIWPLIISLISACYCVMTLRSFIRRRAQFNEFLTSNPSLTVNRYFRLMALATMEFLFTIPISIYGLYLWLHLPGSVQPWISWANIHSDFSRVEEVPGLIWRFNRDTEISVELSRWSVPFCAYVFFAFFGFADEARRHYKMVFWAVSQRLGFSPPVKQFTNSFPRARVAARPMASTIDSIPVYMPPHISKRDSVASEKHSSYKSTFDVLDLYDVKGPGSVNNFVPERNGSSSSVEQDPGAHQADITHDV